MTFCQELGLGDKIVCYSLIPWGNKVTYYDEKSKQSDLPHRAPARGAIKRLWTPFLQALCAHAKEKGWYDRIYIGIDERKRMEKAYDLIDAVTGAYGEPLKKCGGNGSFSANISR